jgi:cardiolipin synthase
VYEFSKTQMHGKVAVIDGEWATVGSSNCDGLSLFLNHEANVVVRDADFARELRKHIQDGIAQSVAIRQEDFSNIPWYKRLWHNAAYLFYKAVLRTITLGDYS